MKAKAIIAASVAFGAIGALYLSQLSMLDQIDSLENRQAYVFEIIRRRQLSPEICEGFSDGWMTCAMNAKKQCECNFEPDELDIANQIYADAVKAAAAAIVAEKKAEDDAPEAD